MAGMRKGYDVEEEKPREYKFNKLYVFGGKGLQEEVYREHFGKFGELKSVYVVKDKTTQLPRGYAYLTYSKASEAALAMEKMNGKTVESRTLKVDIATDKDLPSGAELELEKKMLKLFVIVPKTLTEDELQEIFKQYGDIESVRIVMDRRTGLSKGYGFVEYLRPYHAALAVEQADEIYQCRFSAAKVDPSVIKPIANKADAGAYGGMEQDNSYMGGYGANNYDNYMGGFQPGQQDGYGMQQSAYGGQQQNSYGGQQGGGYGGMQQTGYGGGSQPGFAGQQAGYGGGPGVQQQAGFGGSPQQGSKLQVSGPQDIANFPNDGISNLKVKTSCSLNNEQLTLLFRICPGFESSQLDQNTGIAYLRFASPQAAAYAKSRLHGFPYPIGFRLQAAYDTTAASSNGDVGDIQKKLQSLFQAPSAGSGLAGLAETIQKASALLQQAGISNAERGAGGMGGPSAGGMGGGSMGGGMGGPRGQTNDPSVSCSVPLPARQPLADRAAPIGETVFIVTEHGYISDAALRDIFCRFGNLIDAYLVQGKNFGYAKYADPMSAQKAIETLHGQEILGQFMKVMKSQPRSLMEEQPKKKRRFTENLIN